jgi:hypothetical protein
MNKRTAALVEEMGNPVVKARMKERRYHLLDAAEAAEEEAEALTLYAKWLRDYVMGHRWGEPSLNRARATLRMKRTMGERENRPPGNAGDGG